MSPRLFAPVLALLLAGLGGCAPDAMNNRRATGFNAFLDTIARQCAPLEIGRYEMSEMIERNAMSDDYIYFLDETSRLYYGTLSPASYRNAIDAFFFGGSTNVAIDCIISKLPQNR